MILDLVPRPLCLRAPMRLRDCLVPSSTDLPGPDSVPGHWFWTPEGYDGMPGRHLPGRLQSKRALSHHTLWGACEYKFLGSFTPWDTCRYKSSGPSRPRTLICIKPSRPFTPRDTCRHMSTTPLCLEAHIHISPWGACRYRFLRPLTPHDAYQYKLSRPLASRNTWWCRSLGPLALE